MKWKYTISSPFYNSETLFWCHSRLAIASFYMNCSTSWRVGMDC